MRSQAMQGTRWSKTRLLHFDSSYAMLAPGARARRGHVVRAPCQSPSKKLLGQTRTRALTPARSRPLETKMSAACVLAPLL